MGYLSEAQVSALKAEAVKSYTPGYTPRIISPRTSGGSYTSDVTKTVSYDIISQEQQAKEIVQSLSGETNVPDSIVQSLIKTLHGTVNVITHKDAPTGITTTGRITGDETVSNRNIENPHHKLIAIVVFSVMVVIALIHIKGWD